MNKEEYLKKFAEKLSITIEEVESEYNTFLNEEKEIHKTLPEDQQEQRALQRLTLFYKRQLRSPAVGFEGIVVAVGDCVDIIAKQKREAIELFRIDPMLAVSNGVTNEEGIPLDTRKEWASGKVNPSFGKALPENNFIRNVWVIAKKSKGESAPMFYNMVLSGLAAQNDDIPTFMSVRFQAIDKGDKLNASQFTKFKVDEALKLPDYKSLIGNLIDVVEINGLESYHSSNKDDFGRLVVIEGDVSMLNMEPTAFGSRVMILEDIAASMENLTDAKSLTCWVPDRIQLNFAEGSKVIVVGRTAQGKKKDEAGNATEELGNVTLNVYGIYVLPEFKIDLPEEILPITEETLEIQ